MNSMRDICELAMETGLDIDLSDCPYGDTTGDCPFIDRPTSYYYFLAGFVRSQGITRILEVGTNYGGSIMSMSKGLREDDVSGSRLVTIDVTRKNDEGFKKYPNIKRVHGDSLKEGAIAEALACLDNKADLIYIDSLHEYEHTKENIDIYAPRLNPAYVILDDIRQCEDMKKLWQEIAGRFKGDAFDASDISIRKGAGFGVIRWGR